MNKYLEKIAEKKKDVGIGTRLGAAYAGMVAGGVAFRLPAAHVTKKVMKMVDDPHSHSDLGTIKKMMRDNKLNTTFNTRDHNIDKHFSGSGQIEKDLRSSVKFHHSGPAYMPSGHIMGKGKNFIIGVKRTPDSVNFGGIQMNLGKMFGETKPQAKKIVNKDVIMHELGHAKDFATHGKFKVGTNLAGAIGGGLAPALLLNKHTEDYAAPVALASTIPTLRSEAMANYHAYKGIKAHKGTAAARGFAKKLLPRQMGGYVLNAGALAGGVYAGKKILDHIKNKSHD